jgi:hypothetical protein
MTFGAGYVVLGLGAFGVVLAVLYLLPGLERRLWSDRFAHLEVSASLAGPSQEAVVAAVESIGHGAKLRPIGLEWDRQSGRRVMLFSVKTRNHRIVELQSGAVDAVAALKGVKRVRWY